MIIMNEGLGVNLVWQTEEVYYILGIHYDLILIRNGQ